MSTPFASAPVGARPAFVSSPRPIVGEMVALLRLALPIMLIALVNMGMSLTDTAMVSALYGTEALAAVAVGSDLYSIFFYLGAGTLAGVAPFFAAAVAARDAAAEARLRRIGFRMVVLLSLALAPAIWTAPAWLVHLGLSPALLEDGAGYTRAMTLTLVPMLGVALFRTILTAAEKPRVFLKVTVAMLPLNAACNWLFMTGSGPLPELGPTGAGVSSLVVATASLLVLAIVARSGPGARETASATIEAPSLARVLAVGVPIGVATLAELGIFLGATLYAARLGAADVAAHTLALRAAGVAYAVPAALLQAAMVRMARAEAVAGPDAQRAVTAASLLLSVLGGGALCATLVLTGGGLARLVFDMSDAGIAAAGVAASLFLILGLMELVAGPGSAAAGLLRGRRDTRAPMLFTLAGYWLIGAPVGLWLCEAGSFGITGIWAGLAVGTVATTALALARLALR
jgi:MATE family multidrug resistance protein